jgi:N-glycosylase/DNA lyase
MEKILQKQKLPTQILDKYNEIKPLIRQRLKEFAQVDKTEWFYEMCFCIFTPQSKAVNAFAAVEEMKERDFYNNPFDISPILRNPERYIRFHNQKALKVQKLRDDYPMVFQSISSDKSPAEKRNFLVENINGYGMKEASHFLRNTGHRGLAILDRHILKHLVLCGVFDEIPKVSTKKNYLIVENEFKYFANKTGIPIDELDLLFWSWEAGMILK